MIENIQPSPELIQANASLANINKQIYDIEKKRSELGTQLDQADVDFHSAKEAYSSSITAAALGEADQATVLAAHKKMKGSRDRHDLLRVESKGFSNALTTLVNRRKKVNGQRERILQTLTGTVLEPKISTVQAELLKLMENFAVLLAMRTGQPPELIHEIELSLDTPFWRSVDARTGTAMSQLRKIT